MESLPKKPSLLIVEDDERFLETLTLEFQERGYEVSAVSSLKEIQAKNILHLRHLRFALVDLRLGQEDGLEITQWIHQRFPLCRIVVMTGYGSISTAIQAVKQGAINYVTKPLRVEDLEKAFYRDDTQELPSQRETLAPRESLARHEREYIEYVVNQCAGNITQAAKWLGIHRQSLQRKMKKFSPLR